MKKYLFSFFLGFMAATFSFLALLSMIHIPEYIMIYKVECQRGMMI